MRTRFASNLLVLLMGALMMGERFAFGAGTADWLMFGEACAITVIVAVAFLVRGRGAGQRLLDVALLLIAGWAVVASRSFDAGTASWLGFAEGSACALLALGGLLAHEARMERGVAGSAPAFVSGGAERPGASPPARMTVASGPN